ncbi:MAG: 2-phosphosulfolactate phosphatase [Gemmatimonadetes bacterium]|nr:2-phosphosulfolactate phosphatase [Gemmatimonadota bacterium]
MSVTVTLLPSPLQADVVAIIDVLRFTTSAAYALANGARSIIPCDSVDAARAHRGTSLLAGERHAVRPDGFDFGNSPLEFTREKVQGRDLAWTTTNGTRAIATMLGATQDAESPLLVPTPQSQPRAPTSSPLPKSSIYSCDLVLSSYVNLKAVALLLAPRLAENAVVAIACSGRDGGFALEDAACAGALVRRLQAVVGDRLPLNDAARACACLDEAYGEDLARLFRDAQHGRFLQDHGFGADLLACAALDAVQIVPRWRDGRFVV